METRCSQLGAHLPELRVEALVECRAQVLRAAAAAGAGLAADLPLDHQHVARAPVREGLVVVEQALAEVEKVAIALAVPEDVGQRWRASALDQRAEGIVDRRFFQPFAEPAELLWAGLEPGHVLRLLEARQELDLAKLHGLKAARGRELGAKREEGLRPHRRRAESRPAGSQP